MTQIHTAVQYKPYEAVACRYFDGLLKRGALAHIVAGFVHRRPDLIEQGASLLLNQSNVSSVCARMTTLIHFLTVCLQV